MCELEGAERSLSAGKSSGPRDSYCWVAFVVRTFSLPRANAGPHFTHRSLYPQVAHVLLSGMYTNTSQVILQMTGLSSKV